MCAASNSEKKIDINFSETINILNENKIKYWICHGTLLGIIRDQQLIPWDHDVDIAVWSKTVSRETIKQIMLSSNFLLKKKYLEDDSLTFEKRGGRQVDINFYKVTTLKKNNKAIAYASFCIPKNFFYKLIEALSNAKKYNGRLKYLINSFSIFEPIFEKLKIFLIKKNMFYGRAWITQPLELLKEFRNINFYEIDLIVPKKTEEYLIYMYGKNWKNAIKKYDTIRDNHSTIYHL